MRKLISQMMISLDGAMEGSNGELDWHHVDDEYVDYTTGLLGTADTIVFGRRTYEHMYAFWPTDVAYQSSPEVARIMNEYSKLVVSRTLSHTEWKGTTRIHGGSDLAAQIRQRKAEPGKNMIILASSDLVKSMSDLRLIDEYHLIVNPIVLGEGKKHFDGWGERFPLRLKQSRSFRNGNVLLVYEPA